MISCGEPSGDLYAGALTRELLTLRPGMSVAGLGGPALQAAGGRLVEDYRGLSVTGLVEALSTVPRFLATIGRLASWARTERPTALVLIDFPELNLRLGRKVKQLGIPVVYYISPQVWAWRSHRVKAIRALVDRMLVIFPFERDWYERAGVPVEFVGHPLVDLAKPSASREAFLRGLGLSPAAPVVAVLPGSRPNEVNRLLPDLLAAAHLIREGVPNAQVIVARAPHLDDALFARVSRTGPSMTTVVEGETDAVLASASVALTASGTATVQGALHGTPMVVVYRVAPWSYRLGRRLVRVDTFAMANLIAGERIVPELIQDAVTPRAVADAALEMLTDSAKAAEVRRGLARVRERLGERGASRRAAHHVLDVVDRHPTSP